MSAGVATHVVGLLVGVAVLVAVGLGARSLRRCFYPDWTGPLGVLATSLLALTMVIGTTTVLGTVGLFHPVTVTLGLVAVAAGAWYVGSRVTMVAPTPALVAAGAPGDAPGGGPDDDADPGVAPLAPAPRRMGVEADVFAVVAVVVVVAEWGQRTVWALNHGIHTIDSVWYHLPFAARWTQTGSITPLHFLENEPLTTYYPANGSLVHALGMLYLGTDLVSLLVNLGWLALALLAGWCIGRPWGVAPLSLGVTAALCTSPSLMATQPGGAYNDIAGIALLLGTLAVVVTGQAANRTMTVPEVVLAAAAAGLALGTKFQFIVPVGAATLGVIALAPAGERLRRAAWWTGTLVVTGAFWYVRNLVAVGNPLPAMDLDLGVVHLREAPLVTPISTLAPRLFDGDVWDRWLLDGFDVGVGDLWWVLLGALTVFLILGLVQTPISRFASFVALVTLVAFPFSPAAYGYDDSFEFFGVVVRYLAPGLVLSGAAACLAAAAAGRLCRWAVLAVFAIYLVSTQVDTNDWQEALEEQIDRVIWHPTSLLALAVSAGVLAAGWYGGRWLRSASTRDRLLVAAGALAVVVVVSVPVRDWYLDHRYDEPRASLALFDLSWATDLRDERLGVNTLFQYPYYGPDLSNHVQYLGQREPHGGWIPIPTCREWREALNDGEYTYVETGPTGFFDSDPPRTTQWTMSDPAATEFYRSGSVTVFRIDGELDPDTCPPTG